MRGEDMIADIRATMDNIMRPWAAFIGAVELRPSKHVDRDGIYALDPSKTNATFCVGDPLPQSIVLHPDTVPLARAAFEQSERRSVSDAELAAFLFYTIRNRR